MDSSRQIGNLMDWHRLAGREWLRHFLALNKRLKTKKIFGHGRYILVLLKRTIKTTNLHIAIHLCLNILIRHSKLCKPFSSIIIQFNGSHQQGAGSSYYALCIYPGNGFLQRIFRHVVYRQRISINNKCLRWFHKLSMFATRDNVDLYFR